MPDQSPERAALAEALVARAEHLRLKWVDVAALADISVPTLNRARNTDGTLTSDVKIGLEDALRLQRGSIDTKLAGGEFTPLPEPGAPQAAELDLTQVRHEFSADARARILEMTVGEVWQFSLDMAARSSPSQAAKWLRDAMQLKFEVAVLTKEAL